MRILVSNDDGYRAPGIGVLAQALSALGEVTVVAPSRNRSGASNSLTLHDPLRVSTAENGFHYIDGTPTDCVHLALTGLLDFEPDLVVSGINHGSNMGDDVIYSGTVAAAMEGRHLGLPAIAVSCAASQPQHLDAAAQIARHLVASVRLGALPRQVILNVNIPDAPLAQLKGFEATRLGARHKAEPVVKTVDPRNGLPLYWVGEVGSAQDAGPGTDFYAVDHDYVSVTPLQIDLTQHATRRVVADWLCELDAVLPAGSQA